MGTNAAIAAVLTALVWFGGWNVLVFIFLPTMLLAASIGTWFFYIQHQFEHTSWSREADWDIQDAALEGSSHYDLPPVLRWITANIGVHHVHHLASRIPFYRLPEVLRDHDALANSNRITLRESFGCARFALWDPGEGRLLTFLEARAVPA
jgi:omega-6 fatty acid desaturase (delta-12 desaturase)